MALFASIAYAIESLADAADGVARQELVAAVEAAGSGKIDAAQEQTLVVADACKIWLA